MAKSGIFHYSGTLKNVRVNNGWLLTQEGEYKHDMLQFTRVIVKHWRKTYGTLRAKTSPQAAGLSHTLQTAMVSEAKRVDKVNHFTIEIGGKKCQRCKDCISKTINICKNSKVYLH